jgi:hypothetical protein
MQHVSTLTIRPSDKSAPQTSAPENARQLTDHQMRQVWERMGMMYGHRWKSNYGVEDDGTWRKGLAGLTAEQIGNGLVKCLERRPVRGEEDWPPTLNEFRAMCLPEKRDPIHRDYIALPRPPQDPNVMERSLANMRAALAGKR